MADAANPAAPSSAKSRTPRNGSNSKESAVKVRTTSHKASAIMTPVSIKSRDATISRALA
jgi:hypothetical protein